MSNTTIDKTKLAALHEHLQDGGDATSSGIKSIVGADADVAAYGAALAEEWPSDYGDEPEPAPAPAAKKAKRKVAKKKVTSVSGELEHIYVDEFGVVHRLEVVKVTSDRVLLKKIIPKDLVEILIKGKAETIDLEVLRKLPGNSLVDPYDTSAATLIMLGELSKG